MVDFLFRGNRKYYLLEVVSVYTRIRAAREAAGWTREQFAEKLDVSVSYLAELERGRTGFSVKTLVKACRLLGLSADYVLFGEERDGDTVLLDRIRRIDSRYLPLLQGVVTELLALSESAQSVENTENPPD